MPISLYINSGALAFLALLIIGFFVLSRDPLKKTNRIFCLFSISIACWCVGSFLSNVRGEAAPALLTMRFSYLFGVWVPTLYVSFVYDLSGKRTLEQRRKKVFLKAISFVFSFLVFTPLFIPGLRQIPGYPFWISHAGPVYYAFFIFFSTAMAEVIYQIAVELKRRSGLEYKQFQWVAVANALAILAGFEYFLCVFGVLKRPPFDDYVLVAYAALLGYAVTRYRWLDLDALVRAFRKERLSTLGLLASSINHEIKNPIFVIRGLLDSLLEKETKQPLTTLQREDILRRIYGQVDRISQVIARINRLALESDIKKGNAFEIASLDETLTAAMEVICLVKTGKNIHFSKNIPSQLPKIKIAEGELEEVIINLIANAYDAIPQTGEISIRAIHSKDNVIIEIEDNGIGLTSKLKKQLFRPFFTAHKEHGTGLGLYLCREIVERRGGRIYVKSNKDAGTCFQIEVAAVTERN